MSNQFWTEIKTGPKGAAECERKYLIRVALLGNINFLIRKDCFETPKSTISCWKHKCGSRINEVFRLENALAFVWTIRKVSISKVGFPYMYLLELAIEQ